MSRRMATRRRDEGLTLVELIIAVVLSSIVGGVTVAVLITSIGVVTTTTEISRDATDTGLISTFLARDAQAAGGSEPVPVVGTPDRGVSTAGWGGCAQDGDLVVRFDWNMLDIAGAEHPTTVTWARFGDGRIVRRQCRDGTTTDVPVGEHVAAAVATCRPGPACDGNTLAVDLAITGSATRTATTIVLTATLRPASEAAVAVAASTADGPASPLVVLGAPSSACPAVAMRGARTVVLGGALVDDGCGDGAISGTVADLQPTTGTVLVDGLADPYATIVPATPSCAAAADPPLGSSPAPGATMVHTAPVVVTGNVTLRPGRYVFCQGVTVSDGASLTGDGVFLQVVGGAFDVAAGASVELSSASTGTYRNLVLASTGSDVRIAGGSRPDVLRGVVYAPSAVVTVQSDASVSIGALVAGGLTASGTGSVRLGLPIPTPAVVPVTMPVGQVGMPFTATTLIASGGTAPYTWRATGLPAGLAVSASGVLSGTPTVAGTSVAIVTATDATGLAVSVDRAIAVNAALVVSGPASLPGGQVGATYSSAVTATGGTAPYSFAATGLPAGLTMTTAGPTAGTITGTPTSATTVTVTVTVRDAIGATATRSYPLVVKAGLAIASPSSLPNGTVAVAYATTAVGATGGTAPYTFAASGLPSGLAISASGVIDGTPGVAGTAPVTVSVTDADGATAARTYEIVVAAAPSAAGAAPFAATSGFQVFVEGNTSLSTWEIDGAVATGGNLTSHNFQRIATVQPSTAVVHKGGQPLGLLVGGRVDLTASGSGSELTVHRGWFAVGSATAQSLLVFLNELHLVPKGVTDDWSTPRVLSEDKQTDLATSNPVQPAAFGFGGAFTSLRSTSSRIAALTPAACPAIATPSVSVAYGNHTLTLTSNAVNVWNLTIADIETIHNLDAAVRPGGNTKLVINVVDKGAVTLPVRYWTALMDPTAPGSVMWNFPNATSVTITQSFVGSLLAPNSAVTMYDVGVTGDVVAKSLDFRPWSTKLARFDATIPCIGG